jgi:hypothetical protein
MTWEFPSGLFRPLSIIALSLIWFLAIPLYFMLLYTVIEVQSAAKSAAGPDAKLAAFLVRSQSEEIDQLDPQLDPANEAMAKAYEADANAYSAFDRACDKLVTELGVLYIHVSPTPLAAPDCLKHATVVAYYRSILIPSLDLVHKLRAQKPQDIDMIADIKGKTEDAATLMSAYQDARNDWEAKYRAAMRAKANARRINDRYDVIVGVTPDQKQKANSDIAAEPPRPEAADFEDAAPLPGGAEAAPLLAQPGAVSGAPSVPHDTEAALGSVAYSYNEIVHAPFAGPLFAWLFILPSGVVVAFFTAIMGAIGAAVYSLLRQLDATSEERTVARMWAAYASRPLLGAMAGFMVFFVVSAGAAFLVQPSAVSATDAVNSLSPPALASLGVFAGLAAESALRWLLEKAETFFKTDPDKA